MVPRGGVLSNWLSATIWFSRWGCVEWCYVWVSTAPDGIRGKPDQCCGSTDCNRHGRLDSLGFGDRCYLLVLARGPGRGCTSLYTRLRIPRRLRSRLIRFSCFGIPYFSLFARSFQNNVLLPARRTQVFQHLAGSHLHSGA